MNIILWDVENISFVYFKKFVSSFSSFDKFVFHASKQLPMKENQANQLKNLGWIFKLVSSGKNSSDYALIDHIQNNIRRYNEFHIISGDKGFSSTITMLLSLHKHVFLYIKQDSTEPLLSSIYLNSSPSNLSFFHLIYL